MFTQGDGSPSICLPPGSNGASSRDSSRVGEPTDLLPSVRGALKQRCTQNSERLLRTLADDKDGSRKITSTREGAVSVDRSRRTVQFLFYGVTKPGRVGGKEPDDEAWSLVLFACPKKGKFSKICTLSCGVRFKTRRSFATFCVF